MSRNHSSDIDADAPLSCAVARLWLSMSADDELRSDEEQRVEQHVADCADCELFATSVSDIARRFRIRPMRHDAAFVERVMQSAQPVRLGRGNWMRPALAWCALVVAVQSVQPLLFGEVAGASTHVARHAGATSLALAIGFAVVVWRPSRAAGLLPFVAALALTMVCAAVLDIIGNKAGGSTELVHLSEVAGMILLWMIAGSPGLRLHNHWRSSNAGIDGISPSTQ